MAKSLTKKQITTLSQFSPEALLAIIQDVAANHADARQYLCNQYLMSPEDKLKHIEKEYSRYKNRKGSYEYWKSHAFFNELADAVAEPLPKMASQFPDAVIKISTRLIGEFEKLSNQYDTSSGSWQHYLFGLLAAWVRALGAAFKQNPQFDVVTPYLAMVQSCDYMPEDLLQDNKIHFPRQAIQMIRDTVLATNDTTMALDLSFVLSDFAYLATAYGQNGFEDQENNLRYAQLLLADFRTEQAVVVAKKLQTDLIPHYIQDHADALLVQALYENGDIEEALAQCKHFFGKVLDAKYCQQFIQYHPKGATVDTDYFYEMAQKRGVIFYLSFSAGMEDWARFDAMIQKSMGQDEESWVETLLCIVAVSKIRLWSTTLAQQGFPISAIFLRRKLIENTLSYGKSTYYKYAASDLKKALDFMEQASMDEQKSIPSNDSYIMKLHQQHGRKYSFWLLCADLVPEHLRP